MKITVTGGTGFLGSRLCAFLESQGHSVHVLTRNPGKYVDKGNISYHPYDELSGLVDGSAAVINLAGANLFEKKWTDEVKSAILKSRVNTTRAVVSAIKSAKDKPEVLVSASAVGFYGDKGANKITEKTTGGEDFLSRVCAQWEEEAAQVKAAGVRLAIPRMGIILDKGDGALDKMYTPFKLFVGGPLGSGKQYFPWIHVDDVIQAIYYAINEKGFSGIFNLAAPNPVTMKEFATELGKAMNRPSFFKVPVFALKLILGEASQALTASLRVVPQKLQNSGFEFKHPDLQPALADILDK